MLIKLYIALFLVSSLPGRLSLQFEFPKFNWFHPVQKTRPNPGFVKIRYNSADNSSHFCLEDKLFDFRGFNAPTTLGGSVFETEDLFKTLNGFGTPVTRTYTLLVANDALGGKQKRPRANILGWDHEKDDWIYNEESFQHIDHVMMMAAKHGVKLIIPIINQDYGTEDTDFVGNFNDLIRHRYNISSYRLASSQVDWFTDMDIRQDFKKIIRKLLTRKNTFNGRIYGHDDTVLAWETGNEMNWGRESNTIHDRPAPANVSVPYHVFLTLYTDRNLTNTNKKWTLDIAQLIKELAPNTLIMDGSFSRNPNATAWPIETLQSDLIDIVSYHLYGDPDLDLYANLTQQAKRYNKTLVIGEHGFYSDAAVYAKANEMFDCPGALIWSIRAHNEIGGFTTHGEGNNIYSYHVPGFSVQTSDLFDTLEEPIIRITHQASYEILGKSPPRYPVPGDCYPFFSTNISHSGISWKGAAWAHHYEIWAVATQGGFFKRVASEVYDNVDSGAMFVAIDPVNRQLDIPKRSRIPHRSHAGFKDSKWSSGPAAHEQHSNERTSTTAISSHTVPTTSKSFWQSILRRQESTSQSTKTLGNGNEPIPDGAGWYSVRPISADGHPGPFSKPVYITYI